MKIFGSVVLGMVVFGLISSNIGQEKPAAPAIDPKYELLATDDGLPGAGSVRRYDWFKNLWAQKRSGWAQRVQQDQGALVFLGDSITQGWGDDFKGSFPG